MKTIVNYCKSTYGFKVLMALITCLSFLVLPSCQKDDWNQLNQESIDVMDRMAIKALSGDAPVLYYGYRIFTRTYGKPFLETQKIENPNFNLFENNFVLMIRNGNNKKTRVSSAEIRIDGVIVVGHRDFSKNISLISKQLTGLTAQSILEVELNGTPGSFIDLWIEGTLKEKIVTDIEGNIYKTVTIGTQVWMAENLKTTTLNDGNPIPLVADITAWINLTTPGYCWYDNNEANKNTYGALYNWYAVNTGELCPAGWHVSSDMEWTTLIDYFGGETGVSNKLREVGIEHWGVNNVGATNISGFTALPGGGRKAIGYFSEIGKTARFWTSTNFDASNALYRMIDLINVIAHNLEKTTGFSVRCIKD